MIPVQTIRELMTQKVWTLSPLALKLFLFLAAVSEHPEVTVRGRCVRRGQYLRSLTRLAEEMNVDYRTLKKALFELMRSRYVRIDGATRSAVRNRQEQLINFLPYKDVEHTPTRNADKRVSFGNRTSS